MSRRPRSRHQRRHQRRRGGGDDDRVVGAVLGPADAAIVVLAADVHAQGAEALARLPQGDVARFIGVTPVAFSRIKRRVA